MAEEIERWNFLAPESYSEYHDDDGLLNEFEMMWALRDRFPLHLFVFKQMATHLAHEANVEQVFSRAGLLSDPNINADYLARLVTVSVNKKAFRPSLKAIKAKYYELFRGPGKSVVQAPATQMGCESSMARKPSTTCAPTRSGHSRG